MSGLLLDDKKKICTLPSTLLDPVPHPMVWCYGLPCFPCAQSQHHLPAREQAPWHLHADSTLQATKEAEHREKLSDLKIRIDSCKERCDQENASYQAAQVCNFLKLMAVAEPALG